MTARERYYQRTTMPDPLRDLVAREAALRARLRELEQPRPTFVRTALLFLVGVVAAGLAAYAAGYVAGDRWAARAIDEERRAGAVTCAALADALTRKHDVDLLARCCAEHGGC